MGRSLFKDRYVDLNLKKLTILMKLSLRKSHTLSLCIMKLRKVIYS